jgi:DNA-binding transcriptional regulator YhcF (GntR family)
MLVEPTAIRIDLGSETPAYRQLVDAIRTHLIAGKLKAGDSLPPVRQVASDLGIHFNTVAEAYRILAAEGWLELKRRRGARVLDRAQPARAVKTRKTAFTRRLHEIVAEALAQGISEKEVLKNLRSLTAGLEG